MKTTTGVTTASYIWTNAVLLASHFRALALSLTKRNRSLISMTIPIFAGAIFVASSGHGTTVRVQDQSTTPNYTEILKHPRFHNHVPKGPLPTTLDPNQYLGNKPAFVAYSIAARIRGVLYQLPCYCGCDAHKNHDSLLDCYRDWHGVGCPTCQMLVFFAYEQTAHGQTPKNIRKDMKHGRWGKQTPQEYAEQHYDEYMSTDQIDELRK